MKNRWLSLIFLFLLLALNFNNASAQNYSFRLQSADVQYYINSDGTASIDYTLDFANDPGAHAIDYVDLGLPNSNFDRNSITAEVNNTPITDIQKADPSYVPGGIGVTLGLGSLAIQPGESGTVHVYIPIVRQVIYPSTAQDVQDYVSSEFSPTWFGSQYVHGNTNYTFTLILPAGIDPQEPRYHNPKNWPGDSQPVSGIDDQGRIYYQWTSASANGSTQYTFGASFPSHYVPADSVVTSPTPSTSKAPASMSIDFGSFMPFCCPVIFIAVTILFSIMGNAQNQKRKLAYMPPKISIEGHGIKRGLTAVQAAVLLQEPADKVVTMILFSTIKKGATSVENKTPLKLKIADPLPEGLQDYEKQFIEAFSSDNIAQKRRILQDLMVDLIKGVTQAMKGFSYKETVEYYKDITRRAWEQVESAETPEIQMQKYDEAMDWTMLDRRFEDRTREVFRTGPVFVPMWWGNFDPTYRPTSTASMGTPSIGGVGKTTVSMPTLPGADFAASMVSGIQSFSTNTIGNITNFTSRITNQTNPPPPPSRSSSFRGGGGGCACACACAGCACACAGGGR